MSVISSLALRAGYHRDPSHFPGLSVFESEMRRRTFLTVRQFDLLGAWQFGLRANIQCSWCDTQSPRNLRDEDFDVDTKTLPSSRSDTEITPILFEISKDGLYRIIERILSEQLRSRHMPEDMVWQLDADLCQCFEKIPSSLKLPESGPSPADSPEVIFMKVKNSLLFNKGRCALHRANMNTRNSSQSKSMRLCVQAATSMLHEMVYVFEESGPGGRLFRDRWMRTSVHSSDLFFAASVLCWVMSTKRSGMADLECPIMEDQKESVFRSLQSAQQICDNQAQASPAARKVAKALRYILEKSGISSHEMPLEMTTFDGPMNPERAITMNIDQSTQNLTREITMGNPMVNGQVFAQPMDTASNGQGATTAKATPPEVTTMTASDAEAAGADDPLGSLWQPTDDIDWVIDSPFWHFGHTMLTKHTGRT